MAGREGGGAGERGGRGEGGQGRGGAGGEGERGRGRQMNRQDAKGAQKGIIGNQSWSAGLLPRIVTVGGTRTQ